MRTHDHDVDGDRELRPRLRGLTAKAARLDLEHPGLIYRQVAVAAGRTDVLGQAGFLGLRRAVGNTDSRVYDSVPAVNAHVDIVEPNVVFQQEQRDPPSAEVCAVFAHEPT